ncbi:hypothetical protein QJQ45_007239 [Haematococcus lacustris]|nr:hypothetical protein QJQ45_007239 [Haematococcus lacustris]
MGASISRSEASSGSVCEILDGLDHGDYSPFRQAVLGNRKLATRVLKNGNTGIHLLAAKGSVDGIRAIVDAVLEVRAHEKGRPLNAVECKEFTSKLLNIANEKGQCSLFSWFDMANINGLTPLHFAVFNKRHKVVTMLCDMGANLYSCSVWSCTNDVLHCNAGSTPLHVAAFTGSTRTTKALLKAYAARAGAAAEAQANEPYRRNSARRSSLPIDPRLVQDGLGNLPFVIALQHQQLRVLHMLHPLTPLVDLFASDRPEDRVVGVPRLLELTCLVAQQVLLAQLDAVMASQALTTSTPAGPSSCCPAPAAKEEQAQPAQLSPAPAAAGDLDATWPADTNSSGLPHPALSLPAPPAPAGTLGSEGEGGLGAGTGQIPPAAEAQGGMAESGQEANATPQPAPIPLPALIGGGVRLAAGASLPSPSPTDPTTPSSPSTLGLGAFGLLAVQAPVQQLLLGDATVRQDEADATTSHRQQQEQQRQQRVVQAAGLVGSLEAAGLRQDCPSPTTDPLNTPGHGSSCLGRNAASEGGGKAVAGEGAALGLEQVSGNARVSVLEAPTLSAKVKESASSVFTARSMLELRQHLVAASTSPSGLSRSPSPLPPPLLPSPHTSQPATGSLPPPWPPVDLSDLLPGPAYPLPERTQQLQVSEQQQQQEGQPLQLCTPSPPLCGPSEPGGQSGSAASGAAAGPTSSGAGPSSGVWPCPQHSATAGPSPLAPSPSGGVPLAPGTQRSLKLLGMEGLLREMSSSFPSSPAPPAQLPPTSGPGALLSHHSLAAAVSDRLVREAVTGQAELQAIRGSPSGPVDGSSQFVPGSPLEHQLSAALVMMRMHRLTQGVEDEGELGTPVRTTSLSRRLSRASRTIPSTPGAADLTTLQRFSPCPSPSQPQHPDPSCKGARRRTSPAPTPPPASIPADPTDTNMTASASCISLAGMVRGSSLDADSMPTPSVEGAEGGTPPALEHQGDEGVSADQGPPSFRLVARCSPSQPLDAAPGPSRVVEATGRDTAAAGGAGAGRNVTQLPAFVAMAGSAPDPALAGLPLHPLGAASLLRAASQRSSGLGLTGVARGVAGVGQGKEAEEEEDGEEACGVCLDAPALVSLHTCGHELCGSCTRELLRLHDLKPALCPFCRCIITGVSALGADPPNVLPLPAAPPSLPPLAPHTPTAATGSQGHS